MFLPEQYAWLSPTPFATIVWSSLISRNWIGFCNLPRRPNERNRVRSLSDPFYFGYGSCRCQ